MTTTEAPRTDTFLDEELGDIQPAEVTFDGDIVDIWQRDAVAKEDSRYDKDEPAKVKFVFRDWVESMDREEPRLRFSKWMSKSTHSRAEISKFRDTIVDKKEGIGADPKTWKQFIGLAGSWRIFDEKSARFASQDKVECKGKPTIPMPTNLPIYVPKEKDEDEGEVRRDEPNGQAEISPEAKEAFRAMMVEKGAADGLLESKIRQIASQNMDFRKAYPAAFAAIVVGSLTREVLEERSGKFFIT